MDPTWIGTAVACTPMGILIGWPVEDTMMGGGGAADSGTVAPAAVTAGEGLAAAEDAVPVLMTRG